MGLDENVALARRYTALFCTGDLSAMDEVVAPGHRMQVNGQSLNERLTLTSRITHWRAIFPDYTMDIHETIAQDDRVVLRYTGTGTQHGVFSMFGRTIQPTGRRMRYPCMMLLRIAGGRIVEECSTANLYAVVESLEAVDG